MLLLMMNLKAIFSTASHVANLAFSLLVLANLNVLIISFLGAESKVVAVVAIQKLSEFE